MTTHIIRQQYLQVELAGTEAEGLALQRSLPALCRNSVTPAIEAALDRCAPPDKHLTIERLEVDVGVLSAEHLERDLAQSVAQALEKSLQEQIRRGSGANASGGAVEQRSAAETIDAALAHFLNTGTLPWWFRLPRGKSLEEIVLLSWELSATKSQGSRPIAATVICALASATARQRLIRQFSPLLLGTLLAVLSPRQHEVIQQILERVQRWAAPSDVLAPLQRELWEKGFAAVAAGHLRTIEDLVAAAWSELPAQARSAELTTLMKRQWPRAVVGNIAGRRSRLDRDGAGGAHGVAMVPAAQKGAEDNPRVDASLPPGGIEAKEGIYIDNAGVVLLHPFLPLFFETVEMAAGAKLLQPERALCLLHYVVTGQTVAPEHELPLLKILCGLNLEIPVESDVGLTDAERSEAEELLRSVIGHWQALRDTSPDGLRGAFLLRLGKVTLRDDGEWLLQVEPQTCDILLDQLPWGLSLVKLPWMERMLSVEWRQ